MADIRHRMAERHEKDIAALFKPLGGYKSKGSGATVADKNDGRTDHFGRWPFSWDCKATQGQSISLSRGMLAKLAKDAGGDRPVLPLRIYLNDQLDIAPGGDLVAFTYTDAQEIVEALVELDALKERVAQAMLVSVPDHFTDAQLAEFAEQAQVALTSGQPPVWRPPVAVTPVPDESFDAMSAALITAQDRAAGLDGQVTEQRERADDLARQLREAVAEIERRRGDDLERSQAAQMAQEHAEAGQLVQSDPGELERLRLALAERDQHLLEAARENDRIAGLLGDADAEIRILRDTGPAVPQPEEPAQHPVSIPQLPWMVVHKVTLPGGRTALTGVWWDEQGHSHPTVVRSIRTEPDSTTTERLIVNDRRVREGDLYISGELRLRVGAR
jgi:hypothetical protein